MTESLSAAQRRANEDEAPTLVVTEPPVPVVPVPVAGLVFGTTLEDPDQLGGPVGRPVSVVDALRRQAIRRSGVGGVMKLGRDESDEGRDQRREQPRWTGTADDAGQDILAWLAVADKKANYTVAVCREQIYISKVGGLTEHTGKMEPLKEHIQAKGMNKEFNIWLCKTYNRAAPSNHAEMCVVAAIGKAELSGITFFACTAPSCYYCATFLRHFNVNNSSPTSAPKSQEGWAHPFEPYCWGSQLGPAEHDQVMDLEDYLKRCIADPSYKPKLGKELSKGPEEGRCVLWSFRN